jgi:hypothetical protein
MHFELEFYGDKLVVSYKSSKESFILGTLKFVDGDGDLRHDVRELLATVLETNPMFLVKR